MTKDAQQMMGTKLKIPPKQVKTTTKLNNKKTRLP